MAKKIKKNARKKNKEVDVSYEENNYINHDFFTKILGNITPEDQKVRNTVYSVVFFVLFLFFTLAVLNFGGSIGQFTKNSLFKLLGYGYYVLPAFALIESYFFFTHKESNNLTGTKITFSALFLITILGMLELWRESYGGVFGSLISIPIIRFADKVIGYTILLGLSIISLIIMFDYSRDNTIKDIQDSDIDNDDNDEDISINIAETQTVKDIKSKKIKDIPEVDVKKPLNKNENKKDNLDDDKILNIGQGFTSVNILTKPYTLPPLNILEKDKGKPEVGDIKANANIIKRTLQNFGVQVEMDEISVGPSVTRYALKPAEGVKLSKILGLQNNLSLALAAHPIRIEAPIPGKSLVGIEVPNTTKTMVGLGTLLGSKEYQDSSDPLLIALGKGVSGKMFYENLATMPHALIAGTTGSGKSVMIHNLITSLLYKNSPENLRFIFIDPKRVELTLYNKIPHLLTPVITDPKKAILALKWAAKEMNRRYDILEKNSVRDIGSYHKTILSPALKSFKENKLDREELPDTMPYIVIVIDELADIMQAYPRELEAGIVKLAQMSRAVGIHLVLSTQRPSVNVITGLIKANVPTRLALQVASQIDSRTILDTRGAEELLGRGDMLYMTGRMPNPQRVQSPYITENETKAVVKFILDNLDYIPETISLGGNTDEADSGTNAIFSSSFSDDDVDDEDDMYSEAKQAVMEAGKASTSYLQRKLRIGYSRAARLMDILEKKGIIGPADGSRPREILAGKNNNDTSEGVDTDADDNSDNENNQNS